MNNKFGIIGFGAFGQFMGKYLTKYGPVLFYDPVSETDNSFNCLKSDLQSVCKCKFVILSVPFQVFEDTLNTIAPLLHKNSIVIDVCSIKQKPLALMQKYLPKNIQFLATHPLFGPKSGANGIKGLKIALCGGTINHKNYNSINNFLQHKLELETIEVTAQEHDKQMAYVQGLTHFIAKSLKKLQIPKNLNLTTVTFEHLMQLTDIVSLDSEELYKLIQVENPESQKVRSEFLESLISINSELQQ